MLTMFQGIFKMFYSCQHFPLTVSKKNKQTKTTVKSLIVNVAMKNLYHVIRNKCYAIPCHAMLNNTMSQIAIPYNMHHVILLHAIPCHTI